MLIFIQKEEKNQIIQFYLLTYALKNPSEISNKGHLWKLDGAGAEVGQGWEGDVLYISYMYTYV